MVDWLQQQRSAEGARFSAGVRALEVALRVRDPRSYEHARQVVGLAVAVGKRLQLARAELTTLAVAARLQDVGHIALPDSTLRKEGPLEPADWEAMTEHPGLGAAMLEDIGELADAAPIVRAHHERWDGQGYPNGLRAEEIPLGSRIIAACAAVVAMVSPRPYRSALDPETAVEQLLMAAGTQFDPRVAEAVAACVVPGLAETTSRSRGARAERVEEPEASRKPSGRLRGGKGILGALEQVRPLPALDTARDRVVAALSVRSPKRSEVISLIERDVGLVLEVLRAANHGSRNAAASVPAALEALTLDDLADRFGRMPTIDFLSPRDRVEAALERFRLHAVTTQRAALRIAETADYGDGDELAVSALLHDVGKVALAELIPGYPGAVHGDATSPEARLKSEQRELGVDHALVGGLLARAWSLPERIASAISEHHAAEEPSEATIIRLADALAHHTQGTAAPPAGMLRLSYALGLGPRELRSILFDLPHSEGSRRAMRESCPLSPRELAAVRGLAEGKSYAEIARDSQRSVGTIRSHLHNAYRKLGTADRAQTVLAAADRGWL